MSSSPTFLRAIVLIGIFLFIEFLAAGWKLFPELVDQFSKVIGREANKPNVVVESFQDGSKLSPQDKTQSATPSSDAVAVPASKPSILAPVETQSEVGLPPGATLGIIECKLIDEKPNGGRTLRVAMKARLGSTIDVQSIKIHVYFYEKTGDGEIVLTDSPIRSEWLNPPVGWANGNPQLLDILYSGSQTAAPHSFYGYVVGIYYNGELQDSRAAPVELAREFPPPLYLSPVK